MRTPRYAPPRTHRLIALERLKRDGGNFKILTGTRVPVMHGSPRWIAGSITILSLQLTFISHLN
jgi:hypothetical protein